jgi:hypothetical protein
LTDAEFTVLRQTIARRGTARMVLFPATLTAWAALALFILEFGDFPVASLMSLAVLVGGFEAIHALHVGVERIGRYLQVYYEQPDASATTPGTTLITSPRWESTAMAIGPALPGGGIDPLFSFVFAASAFINLIPALAPSPTPLELGVVGITHLLFIIRIVRARGAAARQRAVELETFRALYEQSPGPKAQSPSPNA